MCVCVCVRVPVFLERLEVCVCLRPLWACLFSVTQVYRVSQQRLQAPGGCNNTEGPAKRSLGR